MTEDVNPFRFGALALDDAFTDRKEEIAELKADVRNGQDVVVFAPRRYGKSSLVWRASQELVQSLRGTWQGSHRGASAQRTAVVPASR